MATTRPTGPGQLGRTRNQQRNIPALTAALQNSNNVVLRQDTAVEIATSGELFGKNLSPWQVEGRWSVAVLRPGAFAKTTLAA